MTQVRITNTVFESGVAKYLAGTLYPATEDTLRQVALRNGEEVDVPTDAAEPAEADPPAQAEAAAPEQPQDDEAKAAAPATPVVARKRAAAAA